MIKGDASARVTAGLVTTILVVVAILVSVSGRIVLYGRVGRTVIDDPWQVWSFVVLCLSGALYGDTAAKPRMPAPRGRE